MGAYYTPHFRSLLGTDQRLTDICAGCSCRGFSMVGARSPGAAFALVAACPTPKTNQVGGSAVNGEPSLRTSIRVYVSRCSPNRPLRRRDNRAPDKVPRFHALTAASTHRCARPCAFRVIEDETYTWRFMGDPISSVTKIGVISAGGR
jgi:hypothetical protein